MGLHTIAKRIIASIIVVSFLLTILINIRPVDVVVRTADVEPLDMSNRYTDVFKSSNISCSDDEKIITLKAVSDYELSDAKIDNVSYDEDTDEAIDLTDEEISEIFEEDIPVDEEQIEEKVEDIIGIDDMDEYEDPYEDASIYHECTFDMDDLVFHYTAEVVDDDGNVLDTEDITTNAIITENGGLDACIEIDGEEYMMSDFENDSSIDECNLNPIKKVIQAVKAYLAVAETAEKVKAKSNYKYNCALEKAGNGVTKGYYLYSQSNGTTKNRKAANYRFGFAKFADVGCEVAAAYNAALALGSPEHLSQTIYYFEAYAIEISAGWGHLGSDPTEIGKYLTKRGFKCKMYKNWSDFSSAVSKKSNCHVIMSHWNSSKWKGLHTFYVNKKAAGKYYGYNWIYDDKTTQYKERAAISSFNNGSGFIVGYVVSA